MRAIDVSKYQGDINWSLVKAPIAIIRMSYGDIGLGFDPKANRNYYAAKAAGKAVGMYHFAGGGDPIAEADFFLKACSPLEENDVMILDWEVPHADPDAWCAAFINRIKERTGNTPMMYMNTSTENSISWDKTRATGAGLWVADYRYGPDADVPIRHWPFYAMHQYTSDGAEPGVGSRVDVNEFFGDIAQWNKYGWHNQEPTPSAPNPVPVEPAQPAPVQQPDPVLDATPPVETPPATTPSTEPTLPPVEPVPVKPATKTLEGILTIVTVVVGSLTSFLSVLVLPPGTPAAITGMVATISSVLAAVNLAIQRTRLKQTAIEKQSELNK